MAFGGIPFRCSTTLRPPIVSAFRRNRQSVTRQEQSPSALSKRTWTSSWICWLSLMMMMTLGKAEPFVGTPELGWRPLPSDFVEGSGLWMEPPKPAPQRALADAFGLQYVSGVCRNYASASRDAILASVLETCHAAGLASEKHVAARSSSQRGSC